MGGAPTYANLDDANRRLDNERQCEFEDVEHFSKWVHTRPLYGGGVSPLLPPTRLRVVLCSPGGSW